MPISIDVPNTPSASQRITLGGIAYEFLYNYNTRNKRLYLSILIDNEVVVAGLSILEGGRLLKNYILPDFNHGDIACVRFKGTTDAATLGNIGIGEPYELIYYTNAELGE